MIVIGVDTHKRSDTLVALDAATGSARGQVKTAATDDCTTCALRFAAELDPERVWAVEDCRHVSSPRMADHELHAFSADGWLSRHLTPRELDQLKALVVAIADNGGAGLVAVVGSVAREWRTPTSDVDVIVIAENPAVPRGLCLDGLSVASAS